MIFVKLTATALALATACSSAAGTLLPKAGAGLRGLDAYVRASAMSPLRSASLVRGRHLAVSGQGLIPSSFAQTTAYPQCDASREGTIDSSAACVACLGDGTCDETTCGLGELNDSQYLLCPVGECCVRYIFGADDELNALVIDGLFLENGELDASADKCPPCVAPLELTCASVDVPDTSAAPGAEVECAEGSSATSGGGGAESEPEDEVTPATRAPAVTAAPATAAPGTAARATAAPAPAPAPAGSGTTTSKTNSTEESGKCFPADATVELDHGGVVRMDALAIGDSVKVGANQFSKVFMFTHKMADVHVEFVTISTTSGASLSLTSGHYIYANDALVAARTVAVGDELMLGHGKRSAVTSVSHAPGRGLYNPQTVSGDIVVNGVVASTYTTAVDPGFAHFMLAPLRALSYFGLSYTGLESGGGSLTAYAPGGVPTIV